MAHTHYKRNEYVDAMGKFYDDTPKAVFAALAFSYAALFRNDGDIAEVAVIEELRSEWRTLHANGIVPHKVPA